MIKGLNFWGITLTIRILKLQLYEHHLTSTCPDRDTVDSQKIEASNLRGYFDIDMHILRYCWPMQTLECYFMRIIWYRHPWMARLLTVRNMKLQLYEDISILTRTDCDTVDRCQIESYILRGYFGTDKPRLRYCWSSEKSKYTIT